MSDKYNKSARIPPAILCLLPVSFLFAALAFDYSAILSIGVAGLGVVPALFISESLRDHAKVLEKKLFEKWDGPPTTRFLRHRNETFDEETKRRIYSAMAKIKGVPELPTNLLELDDPQAADKVYASAVKAARQSFRDYEKNAILFSELSSYGFRRNLFAGRVYAASSAELFALLLGVGALIADPLAQKFYLLASASLQAVTAFVFIFGVTERFVERASERYAHALFDAILYSGSTGS